MQAVVLILGEEHPEGPWCWRCMERTVPRPLLLCAVCARNEERRSRRDERVTLTDEATHERYRADVSHIDLNALRRWEELTDN